MQKISSLAIALIFLTSIGFSQSSKPEIHTFTRAVDGKELKAFIVSHDGEKVKIQIAGRKQFTLDPEIFTEPDQKYIQDWWLKSQGMPAIADLDERVKPGETIRVEMPGLEKTLKGDSPGFTIRIPDNYEYPTPVPIMVFINGGKASERLTKPQNLVDDKEFIIAVFPFPESLKTDKTVAGASVNQIESLQKYHTEFMNELVRVVPNIHPTYRFLAGESNGAHTIGSSIVMNFRPFLDYFHAYILWEGGGSPAGKDYKKAKDKQKIFWVGWGLDSDSMDYAKNVKSNIEKSGANVWGDGAKNTGHGLGPKAYVLIKKWIAEVAMPKLTEIDAEKKEG